MNVIGLKYAEKNRFLVKFLKSSDKDANAAGVEHYFVENII